MSFSSLPTTTTTICKKCNDFFHTIKELNEHLNHVHFICILCTNKHPPHESELALVKHIWFEHPSYFMEDI